MSWPGSRCPWRWPNSWRSAVPIRGRITIVCIGTDRSTGDALGPLVGKRLVETISDDVDVLGTLDEPVHAANLRDVLRRLEQAPDAKERTIIAVDACLGKSESVGYISVKPGPFIPEPGSIKFAACRTLSHYGYRQRRRLHGILRVAKHTLSLVMRMAHVIADGLRIGV